MSKWQKARAEAAVVSIMAEIGNDGAGGGVTAAAFNEQLAALGKISALMVRVNSPGGDVMEGMGIYNAIAALDCEVTCRIEGIAASAASLIAMAADRIEIASNAFMLVHEPFAGVIGTADDLQTAADDVKKMTDAYVAIYTARTGMSADDVLALMREDRLMTADEAKKLGFVDAVIAPKSREAAKIDAKALSIRTRNQLRVLGAKTNPKAGTSDMKKAKANADDQNDGVTLSSLQAGIDELKEAIAALVAKSSDDDGDGDESDDGDDEKDAKDEGDDDADARAADDGDGDESDDGSTENRGAGKAKGSGKVKSVGKSYALAVIELCALAGFAEMAAGFIKASDPLDVVRRKLVSARKTHAAGKTSTHRIGTESKNTSPEALAASWDVAIAKAFPQRKNKDAR